MAETEWEHERFFRGRVQSHRASHRWSRWIPLWAAPAPKEEIRRYPYFSERSK